ncbi:hypothetical protein [Candidatus Enterococcus lemimoniae]|uniref:Uncharacterized protein n=1 Tax=Candidatus Enterococcus lemimoniae TaxID=1834167 RepID=A0ABZ2T7Z2_9ENTE|nr:hypothetical protein [Enterococcus sp. 12C11_DIV0727]OTO71117.1 hypothetical protein A5866_003367 [Enterococcus sp. 12C11_DIV0727]
MENLRKKDIIVSLISSGVDYFTIAKAFDLKFNKEAEETGAVDIGIIPTDPYVIKRARELSIFGISPMILSEILGIQKNELDNLQASIDMAIAVDSLIMKGLEEHGCPNCSDILTDSYWL